MTGMQRLNLAQIRSEYGISQLALAERLGVKQSFLSNVERGKCNLPADKLDMVIEMFHIDDINVYYIDVEDVVNTAKTHSDNTNSIINDTAILDRIVSVVEKMTEMQNANETEAQARLNRLQCRNDVLSNQVDNLREELTRLLQENFTLKELLIKNGIGY